MLWWAFGTRSIPTTMEKTFMYYRNIRHLVHCMLSNKSSTYVLLFFLPDTDPPICMYRLSSKEFLWPRFWIILWKRCVVAEVASVGYNKLEKSNIYQTQTTRPHLLQKISKHGSIQHYFSPSKKSQIKNLVHIFAYSSKYMST